MNIPPADFRINNDETKWHSETCRSAPLARMELPQSNALQNNVIITASKTQEILKSTKLLMKTIGNYETPNFPLNNLESIFQDQEWAYLVSQMKDPIKARQMRRKKTDDERTLKLVYNSQNLKLEQKIRDDFYKGTRKTSLSLLPPNGQMHSFYGRLGLLFNSDYCEIKEHYIFEKDAHTLSLWWKKSYQTNFLRNDLSTHEFELIIKSEAKFITLIRNDLNPTSFKDLRKSLKNQKQDEILPYNELLGSVKKESIAGIFYEIKLSVSDTECSELEKTELKLSAISKKCYIKNQLKMDVPLFEKREDGFHFKDNEKNKMLIQHCLNSVEIINQLAASQMRKINKESQIDLNDRFLSKVKINLTQKLKTMMANL